MSANPTKIVFMGTPEFAIPSLLTLLDGDDSVVLVVTQPDQPSGRGKRLEAPPVKIAALKRNIPVIQPNKISEADCLHMLVGLAPDLLIVVAFGQILPKSVLDIPPLGCVNVHPSILPKYRGAAPINWAIIRGEKATGVTTMLLDEGMDSGDTLLIREVAIGGEETAGDLHDRLAVIGADLLAETIRGLKEKKITPIPQKHSMKTFAPRLKKEDGIIDWSKSAQEIKNHVRGMTPWPGAFSALDNENIKIFHVSALFGKTDGVIPGTVLDTVGHGIVVSTGDGLILISELQLPGKRRMSASEFLRGRRIEKGALFKGRG